MNDTKEKHLRSTFRILPVTGLGRRVRKLPSEGGKNLTASSTDFIFPAPSPGGRPGGSGGGRGAAGGGGCMGCIGMPGMPPVGIIGTEPATTERSSTRFS